MGMKASWVTHQAPNMNLGLEVAAAHSKYLKLHPLSAAPAFSEVAPQTPLTLVRSRARDEREEAAA